MKRETHHQESDPRSDPDTDTTSRRQFFSVGVRCLAVGGLASFTAIQVIKGKRLAGDPNCIRLNTCSDCVEFSAGCQKDKAENFRAGQPGA